MQYQKPTVEIINAEQLIEQVGGTAATNLTADGSFPDFPRPDFPSFPDFPFAF